MAVRLPAVVTIGVPDEPMSPETVALKTSVPAEIAVGPAKEIAATPAPALFVLAR